MFEIIIWTIFFIISMFLLIKGADYFTDSAEKIGLYFKVPSFIIGVTIVALGTSIPELASSISAVFQNSTEIVIGNVLGSNIANILLVLGTAAVLNKKLKSKWDLMSVDLPLLIGSVALISLTIFDGEFSFIDAIFSILGYILYVVYTIFVNKNYKKNHKKRLKQESKETPKTNKLKKKIDWRLLPTLILSSLLIYLGAKYTIVSLKVLASILNINKEIIATFALAIGTSLPELFVSILAAKKGNTEMAIGNVIGSNIFNTFMVMGVPGLITTLVIPTTVLTFILPSMVGATVLFFFITQDNEITRWEGWMMLLLYLLFIIKLFSF